MIGNNNEMTERCTHCGDRHLRVKPIAHREAIDEPVGWLCLACYRSWITSVERDEGCVICAAPDAEYCTSRDLEDLAGEPITAPGLLDICEAHIGEFAVRV